MSDAPAPDDPGRTAMLEVAMGGLAVVVVVVVVVVAGGGAVVLLSSVASGGKVVWTRSQSEVMFSGVYCFLNSNNLPRDFT